MADTSGNATGSDKCWRCHVIGTTHECPCCFQFACTDCFMEVVDYLLRPYRLPSPLCFDCAMAVLDAAGRSPVSNEE